MDTVKVDAAAVERAYRTLAALKEADASKKKIGKAKKARTAACRA